MAHLHEVQAILMVVRRFLQEAVPHPMGKVDPVRDLLALGGELLASDLAVLGNRLEKLKKDAAKGIKPAKGEEECLCA